MSDEKSCVVRIVNLDESFTEESLKNLILMSYQPEGNIKKIYLKRDNSINVYYGYIIFDYSQDALKVVQIFNEYMYNSNIFQVDLIGPNLKYKKYCPEDTESLNDDVETIDLLSTQSHITVVKHNIVRSVRQHVPLSVRAKTADPSKLKSASSTYAQIYITNLHVSTNEIDLQDLLQKFGLVEHIYVGRDRSRFDQCFAYVSFRFRTDATIAINELTGYIYNGKTLKAEWSKKYKFH